MLNILLLLLALLFALPVLVFAAQVLVACWPKTRQASTVAPVRQLSVAVVVPAHNESSGITATLQSIQSQLGPRDTLLLVADNCLDDTAQVARDLGVRVSERFNTELRGKGYALDHGWRVLGGASASWDVFLFVDSDCVVQPGAIDALEAVARSTDRPVQAKYIIQNPNTTVAVKQKVSAFAYLVSNYVRPLGMHRLGLPCHLVGSGMMFRNSLLSQVSLASGHLVEDVQLGLTCALLGKPPIYCPQANVTSEFPAEERSQVTQRTRWEHGRMSLMLQMVPVLYGSALKRRSIKLLGMALDITVPPLSFLILLQLLIFSACLMASLLLGVLLPALAVSVVALALLAGAVLMAWIVHGRQVISGVELSRALLYAFWKIPMYLKFFVSKQTEWVRTGRK